MYANQRPPSKSYHKSKVLLRVRTPGELRPFVATKVTQWHAPDPFDLVGFGIDEVFVGHDDHAGFFVDK
jgi:hypothetical protein